jgi:UDP-3-O-acyl-N-acetylglucosamine deacetylase
MKKRKGVTITITMPKPPELRYAVVYDAQYLGKDTRVFESSDEACKFAEQCHGARVFGLNPEYDFEATHTYTLKVKE